MKGATKLAKPPNAVIPRVSRDGLLPMSFNQENKMQLISEAGESTNNLIGVYRTEERLDPIIIQRAVAGLIARHEILRTSYGKDGSRFFQVIQESIESSFAELDLSNDVEEEQFRSLLRSEANSRVKIEDLPSFHALLIHMAHTDVVLTAVNHIAFDGWSRHIMRRDLSKLYTQYLHGDDPTLSAPMIQYADYASWEREEPLNPLFSQELEYWRRAIVASPRKFNFPGANRRPVVPAYKSASQTGFLADGGQMIRLQELAVSQRVTLSMLMTALFVQLMRVWTGETVILFRTTLPNRRLPQLKDVIGFLANRTLICVQIDGQATVGELISKTRTSILETYANQEVPFQILVDELVRSHDPKIPPLAQVEFRFEPKLKERQPEGTSLFATEAFDLSEVERAISDDVTVSPSKRSPTYGIDLSATIWQYRNALGLTWRYNSELFDPQMVTELFARFRILTATVTDNLNRPVESG